MQIFAERLKELRSEAGLTTKKLGEQIGVSDVCISRWERDQRDPSLENAKNIAVYFKVSTDYLCGLED